MVGLSSIIGTTGCALEPPEEPQANHTVRMARSFEAPPELVWRAWTDPDLLKRWVGSDPNGSVESVRVDAKASGESGADLEKVVTMVAPGCRWNHDRRIANTRDGKPV